MIITDFLWILVWGGMFSGIYNILSPAFLSSPLSFIQGARALLPLLAAYLCLMWVFATKSGFPFFGMPLAYMSSYLMIGIVSSIFLSTNKITALYWACVYGSPILVAWVAIERDQSLRVLRRLIYINNGMVVLVMVMLLPEVFRVGGADERFSQFYMLPLGLGEMRANGVGRFALVSLIIAFTYAISQSGKRKIFWLALLFPSLFMLAQTRSRTSLLGLAVSAILLVLILGLDRRFLIIGPLATYVVYLSGIQWRLHGHVERIMFLTGREYTWRRGLAQIKQSPFLGWGFHADRLLLNSEHMHNSYLHAAIHSGVIGALFFLAAIISIWILISKANLLKRIRFVQGPDLPLLMQSVMVIGFLTTRSLFESTAAFYGVDLLLLVPAMTYIYVWVHESPAAEMT